MSRRLDICAYRPSHAVELGAEGNLPIFGMSCAKSLSTNFTEIYPPRLALLQDGGSSAPVVTTSGFVYTDCVAFTFD